MNIRKTFDICTIKFEKNVAVLVILLLIQLCVIKALDDCHESVHPKIISPLRYNFSKLKDTDAKTELIQEINRLICDIRNFNENITKEVKLIVSNPKIHTRKLRSVEQSRFKAASSEKLLQSLEIKVKYIKDNITKINNQLDGLQINERLNNLEIVSQNLRISLDDLIKQLKTQMYNPENFVNKITKTVDNIQQKLDNLNSEFQAKKENPKLLRAEVIDDIKSRDFEGAARKVGKLHDELKNNINFIVHEVYNNQVGNFDLILRFGDTRDVDEMTSLLIYHALIYEMKINNHNDYRKIVKIFEYFKKINIDDKNLESVDVDLKTEIAEYMKEIVADQLHNANTSKNYTTISEILQNIFEFDSMFFQNTIEKAFKGIANEMEDESMYAFVKNLAANKFGASLSIKVYSELVYDLLDRKNISKKLLIISFALKEVMYGNRTVDENSFLEGISLWRIMPASVANLASATYVCIKNVDRNEYLYASSDDLDYDTERRRVFTWTTGERVDQGVWIIEEKDDIYHIKNKEHNEYLYDAFNEDENKRYVFTWIHKNIDSNQFNWDFEPEGDNVYIKNTDSNEYMFVNNDLYNKDTRRVVYTLDSANNKPIPGKDIRGSLWLIEDCGM